MSSPPARPRLAERIGLQIAPVLIAVVVLTGCAVSGAQAYLRHMHLTRQVGGLERRLADAQGRLRKLEAGQRTLAVYLEDYLMLRRLHLLREDRLGWTEALASAQAGPGMHVAYAIQARRLLARDDAPAQREVGQPEVGLYGSVMRLTVSAVHELAWLDLMRGLRRRAPGVYRVRRCQLEFDDTGSAGRVASITSGVGEAAAVSPNPKPPAVAMPDAASPDAVVSGIDASGAAASGAAASGAAASGAAASGAAASGAAVSDAVTAGAVTPAANDHGPWPTDAVPPASASAVPAAALLPLRSVCELEWLTLASESVTGTGEGRR